MRKAGLGVQDSLIMRGLERFAAGDVAGAARLWLEAREAGCNEPVLEQYLRHVQRVDRGAYEAALAAHAQRTHPAGSGRAARGAASPELGAPPPRLPVPIPVPSPEPPRETPAGAAPGSVDPWGGSTLAGPALEVRGAASGLSMVTTAAADPSPTSPGQLERVEARLRKLVELDNFTEALLAAEEILQAQPQHEAALAARGRCREVLQRMYESKIGDLQAVPRVLVPADQVIWLDLDHRSGFILAQVDGVSTYEDLVDLAGMDPLEALRLLADLVRSGVIGSSSDAR